MSAAECSVQLELLASKFIQPYIGIAIALGVLAIALTKVHLPDLQFDDDRNSAGVSASVMQFPHLILGAVTLFCYVGVEVIAGDTIGLYGSAMGVANTTSLTSFTMTAMVIGYFFGLLCIPLLFHRKMRLKSLPRQAFV